MTTPPLKSLAARKNSAPGAAITRTELLNRMKQTNEEAGFNDPGQEAAAGGNTSQRRFKFVHASEMIKGVGPTAWLIKDHVEAGALAVVFGDPGTYKSFIVLDMACSIASGTPWMGNFTTKGVVFIIIAEGQAGYGKRLAAWERGHWRSLDNAKIFVSTVPARLTEKTSAEEVKLAMDELTELHGKPDLVIIDTLARNFGAGDESKTADMNLFVSHLDQFFGNDITRILVHHSGIADKGRARGSSALKGAVDAEIMCEMTGDMTAKITCLKMKDAPKFKQINVKAEVIELGTFETNHGTELVTSLAMKNDEDAAEKPLKVSAQMKEALKLLHLLDRDCRTCVAEWREVCVAENVYTRPSFYKAFESMCDKKLVVTSDDYVTLSHLSQAVIVGN